jgi:hypothetical protein
VTSGNAGHFASALLRLTGVRSPVAAVRWRSGELSAVTDVRQPPRPE